MSYLQCKFCGCTELAGCSIPFRIFYSQNDGTAGISPLVDCHDRVFVETGPIGQLDPDIEYQPCAWLLPDVCTAPACVEKAYAEALPLAETIQRALDLGLIEEAA